MKYKFVKKVLGGSRPNVLGSVLCEAPDHFFWVNIVQGKNGAFPSLPSTQLDGKWIAGCGPISQRETKELFDAVMAFFDGKPGSKIEPMYDPSQEMPF